MEPLEIKKAADAIEAEVREAKTELKTKKVRGLRSLFEVVRLVVQRIERLAKAATLAGPEKRALAVEVLNRLVDIPFLPETTEAWLIGWAIDRAVAEFNKRLGHVWRDVLNR